MDEKKRNAHQAIEVEDEAEGKMTFLDHLEELRDRLIKSVIALAIATLLSLIFTKRLLLLLIAPMGGNLPQALRPTETIVIYFKVALIGGLVLAMPVIVYQSIRFLLPALKPHEKRYLYILIPAASFSFLLGVAFAAFVMLPFTVRYLQGFLSDVIQQQWAIDNYISFVTTLLFWIGIVFETPLLIFFLAKFGIVTPQMLSANRKFAIVIITVIAAVITPTPDPFNMMIVMGPLWVLYEVGVLLAKLA